MFSFLVLHKVEGGFELVAKVRAADLDGAYELTNHIDHPWQENAGVQALGKAADRARSTSVGDVIYSVLDNEYHEVASVGFKPWVKEA